LALFFVRSRRANIALLSALILLILVPKWRHGAIDCISMLLFGN
jgi:hypothetical protein